MIEFFDIPSRHIWYRVELSVSFIYLRYESLPPVSQNANSRLYIHAVTSSVDIQSSFLSIFFFINTCAHISRRVCTSNYQLAVIGSYKFWVSVSNLTQNKNWSHQFNIARITLIESCNLFHIHYFRLSVAKNCTFNIIFDLLFDIKAQEFS